MTLNVIDIAYPYQAGINIARTDEDAVIVKVSGGTTYVNPKWKEWADATIRSGKMLGLYHYCCENGKVTSGKAEAEFFLKQIKGYEGKAVLILDWEDTAQNQPIQYALDFLDTVAKETGATPFFYAYAAYLNSRNHSAIAKKYPLWMASYLYRYEHGVGFVKNPVNTWRTGNWQKMTMYQYASTRILNGYNSNVDMSIFYGTRKDWQNMQGSKEKAKITRFEHKTPYICLVDNLRVRNHPYLAGKVMAHYQKGDIVWGMDSTRVHDGIVWGRYKSDTGKWRFIAIATEDGKKRYMRPATKKEQQNAKKVSRKEKMVREAEAIAADDSRGYSQMYRWPSQGSDLDCASMMYVCAHDAGYNVTLGPQGVHYTGTMLADFTKAGFTALPFSSVGLKNLKRGDILLNVANHTEMCIGNGKFVGAHSSETGGIYGKMGDQTGREISVCDAYNYPWDYVLRPPAE